MRIASLLLFVVLMGPAILGQQPRPKNREDLGSICQTQGYQTGAELGVQEGHFAHRMLSSWTSAQRYYLVDLWAHQANYNDSANVDNIEQERKFRASKARLAKFGEKPVWLRNDTVSAAHLVPDNSLDFIYVDARHDYCGVMDDLVAWWPKLRKGGLFAGHDFFTTQEYDNYVGAYKSQFDDWALCSNGSRITGAVKGAVLDFAASVNIKKELVYGFGAVRHAFPSWMYPFKT